MAITRLNNNSISSISALPSGVPVGKILSFTSQEVTTRTSTTTTSFADLSGFSMNFTPSSSGNKVLIWWVINNGSDNHSTHQGQPMIKLLRDSTSLFEHCLTASYGTFYNVSTPLVYLDTPNTTSQVTYKLQVKKIGSGTSIKFNDIYGQSEGTGVSVLNIMEVQG